MAGVALLAATLALSGPPETQRPLSAMRTAGFSLLGLGVVGFAGAIVSRTLMFRYNAELSEFQSPGPTGFPDEFYAPARRAENKFGAARSAHILTLGLGSAAFVTGASLLIVAHLYRPVAQVHAGIQPVRGGAGVSATVRF